MKTIAQQLGVKEFPFIVKDKNGKCIYYETITGFWSKWERDKDGNEIYFRKSDEYWSKSEWDKDKNEIYFENNNGVIIDFRPKELTLDEIAKKFGISVEQLKIKK